MEFILPVLIILFLLITSAFFSGGELAMMALDPISIETGVRKGDRVSRLQQILRGRPQRFLSTMLIGYNVTNIMLTAYITALSFQYLVPVWGQSRATLFSTFAAIVTITLFAELMPKTVAAIRTQSFARWSTWPLYIIDTLLTPLNWVIDKGIMPLIRLMTGGRQAMETQLGREELQTAVAMAFAEGQLSDHEHAVAQEAVSFAEHDLADAMTPRVDVTAVAETTSALAAFELMRDTGFSRLPVYRDDIDQILGVLYIKDLVHIQLSPDGSRRLAGEAAREHMRPVQNFPLTKGIPAALNEMRSARTHLAVVVDEHGGTAGIVTLEDILEELVGEIHDETDHIQSAHILKSHEGFTIANGRARPEQIKELEGVKLPESQANTIGGIVMELLGRPAVVNDKIELDGVLITALKVVRNQIKVLRIERTASDPPEPPDPDSASA